MKNYIEVVINDWQVILVVFLLLRLLETILKAIGRKLAGTRVLKGLRKVSILNWVLIVMLLGCFATIAYLTI